MATPIGKSHCVVCDKDKVAYKCEGCSQYFCLNDLPDHHRKLGFQLEDIEHERSNFEKYLHEQKTHPQKHPLIQHINEWEHESMQKIQQAADEARDILLKYASEYSNKIENHLMKLGEQIKRAKKENDFNELHVNQFKQKLKQLEDEFNRPSNVVIQQTPSPFVSKISVLISSISSVTTPNIRATARWAQHGVTVAGGHRQGKGLNQLAEPWSACVDDDQTVYIADTSNHRIVAWKNGDINGSIVAGGNGPGNRDDQLNGPRNILLDKENDCFIICDRGNKRVVQWPRQNGKNGRTIISNIDCCGLAVDNDGYLYVSDGFRQEVKRWKIGETRGTVVAGGHGQGKRLDQFNNPYHIFVDQDQSLYVSDYGNHRVMKWAKGIKKGIIVAGGHGEGSGLTQLSNPCGLLVDQLGTIYVLDYGNNRLVTWLKRAVQGHVILGGSGSGAHANQFDGPIGLALDQHSNLYIVDYYNNRVQKFNIDLNITS